MCDAVANSRSSASDFPQVQAPPAQDCGNPCNVSASSPSLPLLTAGPVLLMAAGATALGRLQGRALTPAQVGSLSNIPISRGEIDLMPESELAAGLKEAEAVLAEARETGVAPGLARQLEEHIQKLKGCAADPFARDNQNFLSNAAGNAERENAIYSTRIQNLLKQINNFARQIKGWMGGGSED